MKLKGLQRMRLFMYFLKLIIMVLMFGTVFCATAGTDGSKKDGWRSIWVSQKRLDIVLTRAGKLNFHAVIMNTHNNEKLLREFAIKAKKTDLESYCCFTPISPDKTSLQQMSVEGEKVFEKQQKLKRLKKLFPGGYQGGGEPLPDRKEVILNRVTCFHRPEVVTATQAKIKKMLGCPELTGIALDMFGYQNYSSCRCPASLKAFEKFRSQHPGLKEKEVWNKFCLDSLVKFQNNVCEYARSIRPEIKITVHVWPVYLPKPLYGNMLDLDYCCQTVAWFFKPYWSDKKIAEYTQSVVKQAKKYHQRQKGIPFIGYSGKSPERFEHELRIILKNDPSHSLSVAFGDALEEEEAHAVLKKVFREFNIIDID